MRYCKSCYICSMITIITPVYNTGAYLRPCLDSILSQTYIDWQLVLVDDGSTDGSGEVCDEYAADPRIEVLHVTNGGAARARNIGIDAARGEWITFIDSDDIVTPAYLADMIGVVTPQCDLVISGWEKDGKITRLQPQVVERDNFLMFIESDNYGYILGKLYRTKVLDDNDLRFDPGVCWAEDLLFLCRALLCCRQVAVIDAVNYKYVTHSDSSINRLYPYDVEMRGFEAANMLMPRLYAEISPRIGFSPYAFLVRAITSLYATPLSRKERLARLRDLEFSPGVMLTRETGLKQRIFFFLVRDRHWRLLDYFLTR